MSPQKKMKPTVTTPSPLRRSERNRNVSSSSSSTVNRSPSTSRTPVSMRHVLVKEMKNIHEENDKEISLNRKLRKRDARIYRNSLTTQHKKNKDCHKVTNNEDEDRSTPDDSNVGEGKVDEPSKGDNLNCKEVSEDCNMPSEDAKAANTSAETRLSGSDKELLENNNATVGSTVIPSNSSSHETSGIPERVEDETAQMVADTDSDSNECLIRKCTGNNKGENLTPKRKSTAMDKCSDVSAIVISDDDDNCNLIVDTDPERLRCNVVETSRPSKRIRGISNVDQPASNSNDEKSCTRNKKEKPEGNNAETEKIRKQQRSLHLSLKPEIAKLCEILLLPDNVKSMAGKFLEYTMNNYKICTEPVSILQSFQLSVCWTAASLLNHKFDTEASLILAKRHLNFDCKIDTVDEINELLWDLKDKFLLLTENSDVNCSPKASVSSSRVHSNTDITTDVEMTKKDISRIFRNIKVSQKHKDQWRELLRMQKENKLKLKKDLKTKIDNFKKQRDIEWEYIIKPKMNEKNREEMIKEFRSGYNKGIAKLKSQYSVGLKALMTGHLEAQKKFRESLSPDELSNLVVSTKEHETPHNAPEVLLSNEGPETSCERTTASELSREAAVGLPSKVSTDYPEKAASLNSSSSTDQISDGGLDGVVSSRPCSSSSPSNGCPATISPLNSPSSTQQVPSRVLPAVTDGQIPVTGPESSPVEAECQLTDNVLVDESTKSDYQEVAHRTVTENTLFQETSVSIPVDPIEPQEQVQPLTPVKSLRILPSATGGEDQAATNEDPLSSQIPEALTEVQTQAVEQPALNLGVDSHSRQIGERALPSVTGGEDQAASNEDPLSSQIPEVLTEVQTQAVEQPALNQEADSNSRQIGERILPSVTGGEDQAATNEDPLSSQIPEALTEVQTQAVEQPALNLEADSNSRQVVPPVSNMVLDSLVPGGIRAQSSDTRNMSTHRATNSHPIHTPASRTVRPFFYDPLSYELAKIRNLIEQNLKKHEDSKLQLKCNFEKEMEELRRKYDIQMKEIEVEFQEKKKNYDTQYKTVYLHRILADTVIKANFDPRFSGASGMLQGILPYDPGFSQHLFQPPRQPNATWPSPVASPSYRGLPATTFQNSHASTGSHTMVPPPIRAAYSITRSFSGYSARLPHINSIASPSGHLQAGGEICGPPPHLTPYRPSASAPASSLSGEIRSPPPHLSPYRPSTSVPASNLSGEIRTHAPHLLPYRPSTSVPASNLSGEIRTPAPHLSPYRPSTSVPASNLSGEIRTPAPHLSPYRPSTSVPASSRSEVPHGMPSQPAPGNPPAPLSQQFSRPMPTISQFGPHRGHGHENTGGFLTPNVSAMDMRMVANSQSSVNLPNTMQQKSDLASLNHSQFGTTSSTPANSAQEPTPDVVCLSDDD